MYKKLINIVEDFNEFRRVRRMNKTSELSSSHKGLILSYNPEFEKELDSIILNSLTKEMLNGDASVEYIKGFRSALTYRLSLLTYRTKFK